MIFDFTFLMPNILFPEIFFSTISFLSIAQFIIPKTYFFLLSDELDLNF